MLIKSAGVCAIEREQLVLHVHDDEDGIRDGNTLDRGQHESSTGAGFEPQIAPAEIGFESVDALGHRRVFGVADILTAEADAVIDDDCLGRQVGIRQRRGLGRDSIGGDSSKLLRRLIHRRLEADAAANQVAHPSIEIECRCIGGEGRLRRTAAADKNRQAHDAGNDYHRPPPLRSVRADERCGPIDPFDPVAGAAC